MLHIGVNSSSANKKNYVDNEKVDTLDIEVYFHCQLNFKSRGMIHMHSQ
jgi:hypothetical protein